MAIVTTLSLHCATRQVQCWAAPGGSQLARLPQIRFGAPKVRPKEAPPRRNRPINELGRAKNKWSAGDCSSPAAPAAPASGWLATRANRNSDPAACDAMAGAGAVGLAPWGWRRRVARPRPWPTLYGKQQSRGRAGDCRRAPLHGPPLVSAWALLDS